MNEYANIGNRRLLVRSLVALVLTLSLVRILPDFGNPETLSFAKFCSGPLNTAFLVIGYLGIFSFAIRRHNWRTFNLSWIVLVTITAFVQIPKLFIHAFWAARPSGNPGGFPSGHAAASFGLAYLLSGVVPRLWPVWYGIAAMITWSRVENHDHWFYQVAVGAPLGLLVAVGTDRLLKGREKKSQNPEVQNP